MAHICAKYHTSYSFMKKSLNAVGIQIINPITITKFNENIFDVIDTEEKAYWLGFIFADGYVSNTNGFELSLAIKDYQHLVKFNLFVEHKDLNHVKINKASYNKQRCRWSVKNTHFVQTLNNLGCVPRKSLILEFPKLEIFKDPSLIRHFIRGYFDGDGCISRLVRKTTVSPDISLLGTPKFINKLLTILSNNNIFGKVYQDKKHTENTKILRFDIYNGILFINYLYDNSNIYLDRKYKLYQFFRNGCRSKEEFLELSSGNIGENPEMDNTEINSEIAKGSESSYSVESEQI